MRWSQQKGSALLSRATQSEVDDFRRGVDSYRIHVADSIGHNQLTAASRVKSRPVTKQKGTHAALTAQHPLAAVRGAGKRQRHVRLNRRVESVGMMRQQNREGKR